jgi:hypothetical protein
MPRCPQCTKPLEELARRCPSCQADLDLLVEYVNQLDDGLRQAEALTREGELDGAVWKYLEVLEVDPDNATARRQVGKVATAVRQFDRLAPGRRWISRVRGEDEDSAAARAARWLRAAFVVLLIGLAFAAGYAAGGGRSGEEAPAPPRKGPEPKLEPRPGDKRPTLGGRTSLSPGHLNRPGLQGLTPAS